MAYRPPAFTCGRVQMRTVHVTLPRRIFSRSVFANTTAVSLCDDPTRGMPIFKLIAKIFTLAGAGAHPVALRFRNPMRDCLLYAAEQFPNGALVRVILDRSESVTSAAWEAP